MQGNFFSKSVSLVKQRFIKLSSFVPLKAQTAILFSFAIGYLSLFLPYRYVVADLHTPDNRVIEIISYKIGNVPGPVYVRDCSYFFPTKWLIEANWFLRYDSTFFFFAAIIYIPIIYLGKYVKKTTAVLWKFFITSLILGLVPALILIWLIHTHAGGYINCDYNHSWSIVVKSISVAWFPVFARVLSLLLGIYAFGKKSSENLVVGVKQN